MSRLSPESIVMPRAQGSFGAPAGQRAVVVGGGIAGVAAATVLAERGVRVTLIEREPSLGGRAGGFPTQVGGETLHMERGFHAFFRQYYNLQNLLRRVDPELEMLTPLVDYPILGPQGMVQSFRGLPKRTPLQIISLVSRTPHLTMGDLARVNGRAAMQMLTFDMERTYARFDGMSAGAYLDSLAFPEQARRMLFDVFAHSFFNPEETMSAAELLMMFHFYFTGNPEGLVFDVVNRPLSRAIWEPFARWLEARDVCLHLSTSVQRVERQRDGRVVVHHDGGSAEGDMLVLALDVDGLRRLAAESDDLAPLSGAVSGLSLTHPFAVYRLWLDRPVLTERPAFAGTTGVGMLDNISVYERFQDESAAWARRNWGSVVELHAYAVPPELDEAAIKADLLSGLHTFYPETRSAKITEARFLLRRDCPSFPVDGHDRRPGVATVWPNVALAGDGIRVPVPCALMERATISGFMAASTLLAPLGVRSEAITSVPRQGLFAGPRLASTQPGRSGSVARAPQDQRGVDDGEPVRVESAR